MPLPPIKETLIFIHVVTVAKKTMQNVNICMDFPLLMSISTRLNF